MFTINIYLRLGLIAAGLIGGVALMTFFGFWYGFPFFLTGIVLLVGYFLLGTVQSASMMLQTQDMDGADKQLNLTYFPQWLYKTNRAYFYMLKGMIAGHKKDTETAEKYLLQAQATDGLTSDNEKATIELQLANFAAMKSNWSKAQIHVTAAEKYKITEPMLKDQLKQFSDGLKQRSAQMKQMNIPQANGFRGNNMNVGGKRPRPRMR
jgi:hypothetical protein